MSGYELSRKWFAFAYETKGVRPVHTALYFWIIERANASGWKKIIDVQTEKSMECLGVTDWRTYKNALQFLADNGFIHWIEKSKNQYTCNRVALIGNLVIDGEAMRNAYANNAEPNAEAIAEAIAEAYAEAHVKAIAEALQSYINLKTTKPSNPKTSKPSGVHQLALEAFKKFYAARFKTEYIISGGKDGAALKELLGKVRAKTQESNLELTDENVLAGFNHYMESITDEWVLDKLSISLINSQFNQLFKSAKNGKPGIKINASTGRGADFAGFRDLVRDFRANSGGNGNGQGPDAAGQAANGAHPGGSPWRHPGQ